MKLDGIIIKGIGGCYYVRAGDELYECKARGVFRKQGVKTLAGDRVSITVSENSENSLDEIHERKSVLMRPPVANVDRLFVVASVLEPDMNLLAVDRLTAIAQYKDIEPVVLITKSDLSGTQKYVDIYKKANIRVISVSCVTGEGIDEVREELKNHISAFTGNTGVGKSSVLNAIDSTLLLQTGEISDKLGRGRHTTRHSELFAVEGGYVADTPGFAAFELEDNEAILKENLAFAFKEFEPYLGTCRFSTCTHTVDKGCSILQAVQEGKIALSRHESYKALYEQAKKLNEWEIK